MSKEVKYASKFRQTVAVDVGHLSAKGGRIGGTVGERRALAKAPKAENPTTKSTFQRVKDFLGFRTAGSLPAPNAEFVNGDIRHPFHQLAQGKPANTSLYDDRKLVAYLNTVSPQKKPTA